MSAGQCSVNARARGDVMVASAPPAQGFLLLEIPGPWGPDLLQASHLRTDVARPVRAAADAAGLRLLLIRRPGRHPDRAGPRRWGVVAVGGRVRWGRWAADEDLLRIDVAGEFASVRSGGGAAATDPDDDRPLALVCTQGRHDLCCATEGRPVVAAAMAMPGMDVWECSHLGGDRFAANLLWLPSGHLFGGLSAGTVEGVLTAAGAGRVVLEHYRGRFGTPPAAQAATLHLMRRLGEDRPDRIRVDPPAPLPAEGVPFVVTARHGDAVHDVRLRWRWSTPQRLTCQARNTARVRLFEPA